MIDTGILAAHQDFGGRASVAMDFVGDGQNGNDCDGHGTYVAGILGGQTFGVAKGVTIHAIRVLDCTGNGTMSAAIAAVNWITANKIQPALVNMSLSGDGLVSMDTAVQNSIASGVTYVVAASNDNADVAGTSPARVPQAITVAATDSGDNRASFSNFGPLVDLFAPGAGITSDWIGSSIATKTESGTSASSPFVAGVVAQYLQTNPATSPASMSSIITGAATKNVVVNPGAGSPNALLYVNFPMATVTIGGAEQRECRIQTPVIECGGGIIFDTGWVSVTVNGRTYSTSYGKLSTTSSIAAALAASINSDPSVLASSAGPVITLSSRDFSCYSVSANYNTSNPNMFNPSFTATVSAPNCS